MEKELKSYMGVLLRTDLTRPSAKKVEMAVPCYVSPQMDTRAGCSTTFLAPHIKKLETYFALLYLCTVCNIQYGPLSVSYLDFL